VGDDKIDATGLDDKVKEGGVEHGELGMLY
jgi:hypothetical protein